MGELKRRDSASTTERPKSGFFRRALSLRHRLTGRRKSNEGIRYISSPIMSPLNQTPTEYLISSSSANSLPSARSSLGDPSRPARPLSARPMSAEFWPASDPIISETEKQTAKLQKSQTVKKLKPPI